MANDFSHNPSLDDWDSLPLDPTSNDWDDQVPGSFGLASSQVHQPAGDALGKGGGAGWEKVPNGQGPRALEAEPSEVAHGDSPGSAQGNGPQGGHNDGGPRDGPGVPWDNGSLEAGDKGSQEGDFGEGSPEGSQESDFGEGSPEGSQENDSGSDDDDFGLGGIESSLEAKSPGSYGSGVPEASPRPAPAEARRGERPPAYAANGNQERSDFLKSLMDGDSDVVPQKVELDLDGIFDMARKEAETISPDSTFQPVEAPAPAPEPEHEQEAEVIDTAPLNASAPVKKVARFKMILVVATLSLIGLGLVFVVYTLLFNKPKAPVLPLPTYEADPIDTQRVPISGEMPLERFIIPMVDRESPVTVEMALILHYRDQADESVLKAQEVQLRDISYRLAKEAGASLLTDTEARQRFQANLLATLNNIDQIKADPENPRLTYVQISLLRRR